MTIRFRKALVSAPFIVAGLLISISAKPVAAQQAPLTLIDNITLPGIVGDFDFFEADLKRNHIFAAAEEHASLELFEASTGKPLQSIPGFKTPHTLAFVADRDEVFVADGGDSSVIVMSASDYHQVDRIPMIQGVGSGKVDSPDTAFYDEKRRIFFVGNGGKSADLPYSEIAEINVDTHKIVGKIRVEANNLEGMMVDEKHDRLYVNMRDQKKVAVIDLKQRKVVDTWTTPDMNLNSPLAYDEASQRLFIAGRKPGLFYAIDVNTGKVVSELPVTNMADSMIFDAKAKRLYLMAFSGTTVIQQETPDTYTVLTKLPTNGAKTGLYLPAFHQLYLLHPQSKVDDAGMLVYHVNP